MVGLLAVLLILPTARAIRRSCLGDELVLRYHQLVTSRLTRGIIDDYLRTHSIRKLQLGAGPNNLVGWLNTDIFPDRRTQAYLDASKPFPLPDQSFRYVFAEQLIEHLTYEQALVMLRESYRILAPGGKLRVATPNLLRLIQLYNPENAELKRQVMTAEIHRVPQRPATPSFMLNLYFRGWGHQFIYDPQTLAATLQSAGFRDVRPFELGESDDVNLRGIERHGNIIGWDVDRYTTMVLEATRP